MRRFISEDANRADHQGIKRSGHSRLGAAGSVRLGVSVKVDRRKCEAADEIARELDRMNAFCIQNLHELLRRFGPGDVFDGRKDKNVHNQCGTP